MIVGRGIFKAYNKGAVKVLNGVSVDIEDSEFAVILGASGCGKTTLLSVLSGLERADGGSVVCNDCDLSDMSDKQLTEFRRKHVGFVFQQYYLLEHLTVDGNVKLGADLVNNKDYREIIDAVGLSGKLKSKPSELSGGEQQRVCIARALAKKPNVLFLDEPTGALDEATGRNVLDYIMKLKKELGFTMIMVTHNGHIAQTADSVINLNSGKIVGVQKNPAPKSAYKIGW
ncbi:MAG: ABC transporter ATP-binding protein [Clostridiales bacterium]|nr:ABC transporter ATP-binding protein [Clostridiales bacterium]